MGSAWHHKMTWLVGSLKRIITQIFSTSAPQLKKNTKEEKLRAYGLNRLKKNKRI